MGGRDLYSYLAIIVLAFIFMLILIVAVYEKIETLDPQLAKVLIKSDRSGLFLGSDNIRRVVAQYNSTDIQSQWYANEFSYNTFFGYFNISGNGYLSFDNSTNTAILAETSLGNSLTLVNIASSITSQTINIITNDTTDNSTLYLTVKDDNSCMFEPFITNDQDSSQLFEIILL